jgi:hypothetical protein
LDALAVDVEGTEVQGVLMHIGQMSNGLGEEVYEKSRIARIPEHNSKDLFIRRRSSALLCKSK